LAPREHASMPSKKKKKKTGNVFFYAAAALFLAIDHLFFPHHLRHVTKLLFTFYY
jgi:hypothetical protein